MIRWGPARRTVNEALASCTPKQCQDLANQRMGARLSLPVAEWQSLGRDLRFLTLSWLRGSGKGFEGEVTYSLTISGFRERQMQVALGLPRLKLHSQDARGWRAQVAQEPIDRPRAT